jgi:hypothetical protein
MTTLTIPSLEGRLLRTVGEQVAAEPLRNWPPSRFRLCLNIAREIRQSAVEARRALEEELAQGVEARSFIRKHGGGLAAAEEYAAINRRLIESLIEANDPRTETLVAELRLLEQEEKAIRDLLSEALSLMQKPSRPVDWDRLRAAEEADARGEMKPFYRR